MKSFHRDWDINSADHPYLFRVYNEIPDPMPEELIPEVKKPKHRKSSKKEKPKDQ